MSRRGEETLGLESTLNSVKDTDGLINGGVFSGDWDNILAYAGLTVLLDGAAAGTADGTLYMEFSHDGVAIHRSIAISIADITNAAPRTLGRVAKFFRVRYVNGTTASTLFEVQTLYHINQIGLVSRLDQQIGADSDIALVRSVSAGQRPDGEFINSPESGNLYKTTANLPDGSLAQRTYSSGLIDVRGYHQVQTHVLSDRPGTIDILFYSDDQKADLVRQLTLPYIPSDDFELFAAPTFSDYVEYCFINDAGGAQADFLYETKALVSPLSGQVLGVNAPIDSKMVANLNRSITVGEKPDGSFHNIPHNGKAYNTIATMLAGVNVQTGWFDTDSYNVIELFINSDVSSAKGGIIIEFTDDLDNPTVQSTETYTFNGVDISLGFKNIFIPPKLVGFRVRYVNGGDDQTSFIFQIDLKTSGTLTSRKDQIVEGPEPVTLTRPVTNFDLSSAREHIDGQESLFFFGQNHDLNTSTFEDVWPGSGDLNFQTTAAKIKIASTHAADDSAGLGLRSVEIHGLSATGEDQKETVALSGTTPVESVLTYIRVNLMHNEEVGTYGGSHQGDIECRVTNATFANGDLLAKMVGLEGAPGSSVFYGYGESQLGITSIPLGKVAYITRLEVIPQNNKKFDIVLYERDGLLTTSAPFQPRRILWSTDELKDDIVEKTFKSHIKIKSLADIWFRALGVDANAGCSVSLDYYLVDEDANGQ